jgi:hypothetical protein
MHCLKYKQKKKRKNKKYGAHCAVESMSRSPGYWDFKKSLLGTAHILDFKVSYENSIPVVPPFYRQK